MVPPVVSTLELLIHVLSEAFPGQDIAIAKKRALARYKHRLGEVRLVPADLNPAESASLNEWAQ
jgi:hypothetical protein